MKKVINFDEGVAAMTQDYANRNTNGNYTEAVDQLLRGALLSDKLAESKKRHLKTLKTAQS